MTTVPSGAGRSVLSAEPSHTSSRARSLVASTVVCDAVIPYEPEIGNDTRLLPRWANAGFDFVSVHPAGDRHTAGEGLKRLARCRADILARRDALALVTSVADIHAARRDGKLGVGIHLEGSNPLEESTDLISAFYDLGVRFMHPVFNVENSFGGGCADRVDAGLTEFGARAVREMNRVGMLLDGAHAGRRTSLEMIEQSTAPVVFSHQGCDAVRAHVRNVTDEQIRACAASGGVVGISGAGFYLGGGATAERLVRHVDHIAQLVGPEHAGLGLDYVHDTEFLSRYIESRPEEWPGQAEGMWEPVEFVGPESVESVAELLLERGYPDADVAGILGGNWLRVFGAVWKRER